MATAAINRRELLRRVALSCGGTLSAPAILGVLQGHAAVPTTDFAPRFFTAPQLAVVSEIAEIILPRTDTPGARDVGVPAFIDRMLKEVYPSDERARCLAELAAFEAAAQRAHNKPFLALETERRTVFVAEAHDAALRRESAATAPRPFILVMKELTMLGFFTSEIGATQVLQYDPVPGAYRGCVPLSAAGAGRTWALETSLPF